METNSLNKNDCELLRAALGQSLPSIEPDNADSPFSIKQTYVPASHFKALQPENVIVVGMRGAGKSFWTNALSSEKHRQFLKSVYPDIQVCSSIVSVGFRATSSANYPDQSVLGDLSKESRLDDSWLDIWRAVIMQQIPVDSPFPKKAKWAEGYRWVKEHHEDVAQIIRNYDAACGNAGKSHFILFDAIDRLASTWEGIRPLAKSLFQLALEFQRYRSIHLKIFVRPDFLEDTDITAFPDGSKLLARKVTLGWRKVDLFALLFQSLANAEIEGGLLFRQFVADEIRNEWRHADNIYLLPNLLKTDEAIQKRCFEFLAGKYMAMPSPTAHKRGFPYTWLPNHLVDANEAVSPRSFCAALRTAAEYDGQVPDKWNKPLFYKGLYTGVQEASKIRVNEIREDYPWVEIVLRICRNQLSVPCKEDDLITFWKKEKVVKVLNEQPNEKLNPLSLNRGEKGILEDILALGIISRLGKDRIQMPDVYRVAYGISRKGGVPRLK